MLGQLLSCHYRYIASLPSLWRVRERPSDAYVGSLYSTKTLSMASGRKKWRMTESHLKPFQALNIKTAAGVSGICTSESLRGPSVGRPAKVDPFAPSISRRETHGHQDALLPCGDNTCHLTGKTMQAVALRDFGICEDSGRLPGAAELEGANNWLRRPDHQRAAASGWVLGSMQMQTYPMLCT